MKEEMRCEKLNEQGEKSREVAGDVFVERPQIAVKVAAYAIHAEKTEDEERREE